MTVVSSTTVPIIRNHLPLHTAENRVDEPYESAFANQLTGSCSTYLDPGVNGSLSGVDNRLAAAQWLKILISQIVSGVESLYDCDPEFSLVNSPPPPLLNTLIEILPPRRPISMLALSIGLLRLRTPLL